MGENTAEQRQNWKAFKCAEGAMVMIDFGPDRLKVAPTTREAWEALERVFEVHDFIIDPTLTSSYNCRQITGGTGYSLHSYGIAVDVNSTHNPYRKTPNGRAVRFSGRATVAERRMDVAKDRADTEMTPAMIRDVTAIRTRNGKQVFEWGGNWKNVKDAMHFEIDCKPADLESGVDWATVVGGEAGPDRDEPQPMPETGPETRPEPGWNREDPDRYWRREGCPDCEARNGGSGYGSGGFDWPPAGGGWSEGGGAPELARGIRLPDFSALYPRANPAVLVALRTHGAAALARHGILKTERRFAWFMAQLAHESGGFARLEENLRYSAGRIVEVFGKYIPTLAQAQAYAGNPQRLANRVYGARNGNGPESTGDGYRYRGRGLIQLTFRDNYRTIGRATGLDFENNPDLAADPAYAWDAACGYWTSRDLNRYCDSGDFRTLTRRINGGFNGLADRENQARRIERYLDQVGFTPMENDGRIETGGDGDRMGPGHAGSPDDLSLDMRGHAVRSLQIRLNELHYFVGAEDGIFGKLTQAQVLAFQAEHGLEKTGVVDAAFRSLLETAQKRNYDGDREGIEEGGMVEKHSEIVKDSTWTRLIGKIGATVGGIGLFNSGIVNSVAPAAPPAGEAASTARTALNVFEMLANNAGGGNISAISGGLGKLAATLLPGAGGSALMAGLGIASWLISNRVISKRIQDHRMGRNIGR